MSICQSLESYPWFGFGYVSWNLLGMTFVFTFLLCVALGSDIPNKLANAFKWTYYIFPDVIIYIVHLFLNNYNEVGLCATIITVLDLSKYISYFGLA